MLAASLSVLAPRDLSKLAPASLSALLAASLPELAHSLGTLRISNPAFG